MALLPDIVYVVKPGDSNPELRHSLRSLRNVPHRRVFIAGHVPSWLRGVFPVPTDQTGSKYQNSTRNLRAALQDPRMGERVLLMNDDFFILRPLPEIPVLHRGPVDDVEDYYEQRGQSHYLEGLRQTRRLMADLGIERPLSYELHVPLPFHRDDMLKALDVGQDLPILHKRTLYGNLFGIRGGQMRDCKILRPDQRFTKRGAFVSTMPQSFRYGAVGNHIRALFPDPCRYEGLLTH